MTTAWAMVYVGALDAALGLVFWALYRRAAARLTLWPDPGPWGSEAALRDRLRGACENLRVWHVVCINSGASMVCAGVVALRIG